MIKLITLWVLLYAVSIRSETYCSIGQRFDTDLKKCIDIDECLEKSHQCDNGMMCTNTQGSYNCECPKGYKKSIDDKCEDINECVEDMHSCDSTQKCENTIGDYRCSCKVDHYEDPLTRKCTAIVDSICKVHMNICNEDQICVDKAPGKYVCENRPFIKSKCVEGYRFDDGAGKCLDINECDELSHSCGDNEVCENKMGGHLCKCAVGFIKKYVTSDSKPCLDENECKSRYKNKCSENEHCLNTVGSYRCACKQGYERDPTQRGCRDIDECKLNAFNCTEPMTRCVNIEGSYKCDCPEGFEQDSYNQTTCTNINECLDSTICGDHGSCFDMNGTYTCKCHDGFINPSDDFKTCIDLNECLQKPCTQECNNFDGGYSCSCYPGFILGTDKKTCFDVDECELAEFGKKCSHKCLNKWGNYTCLCPQGFRLDDTGFVCKDINECLEKKFTCEFPKECVNIDGSYTCECPIGYDTIMGKCLDIDECRQRHTCGSNSKCVNQPGSYTCECDDGFVLNNTKCEDADECSENDGKGPCQQHCENTHGSFFCTCNDGYELSLDRKSCQDIDECKEGLCPWECENSNGSYTCTCPKGFYSDDGDCIDIDECNDNNQRCDPGEICFNTMGSFQCEEFQCPPNYEAVTPRECHFAQICDERDNGCLNNPKTIKFVTQSINYLKSTGFNPNGEKVYSEKLILQYSSYFDFDFELTDVKAVGGIEEAKFSDFSIAHTRKRMDLMLKRPLEGPQTIKIEIRKVEKSILYKEIKGYQLIQLVLHVPRFDFAVNKKKYLHNLYPGHILV